jgi:hypothetical protein
VVSTLEGRLTGYFGSIHQHHDVKNRILGYFVQGYPLGAWRKERGLSKLLIPSREGDDQFGPFSVGISENMLARDLQITKFLFLGPLALARLSGAPHGV